MNRSSVRCWYHFFSGRGVKPTGCEVIFSIVSLCLFRLSILPDLLVIFLELKSGELYEIKLVERRRWKK